MTPTDSQIYEQSAAVTIRRLTEHDRDRIEALAERDSRPDELPAPILGAEVEGRLLAAMSVASGEVVADPFSRTAEVRSLLELRATQLRRRNGFGRHRFGAPHSGRARGALPGSPSGAGGRLLTLLPRF